MASRSSSRTTARTQRRALACHHEEPPVLRVLGTKDNPGRLFLGCVYYQVHEECNFFCWVDAEQEESDPEKEQLRKKVVSLKFRLKAIEWKMKVAVYVELVGWFGLMYLWFADPGKMRSHHVMPLKSV
ncbi:hypothetical protein PIB30_071784 [Stylosanthes scabra]|uniref:GRF-type domain-containing protein n=1 Tax=Stylosanthes scabra TaxID=79078 RepID=A0ABU6SP08_9FABA|nr:hypothetical protein [Stylosanthes scabra]